MARNKARPGRTVVFFFLGLAVAYGLVAALGTWKPALGLDLQGGTQIILTAKGTVSKDNLNEAATIIEVARATDCKSLLIIRMQSRSGIGISRFYPCSICGSACRN